MHRARTAPGSPARPGSPLRQPGVRCRTSRSGRPAYLLGPGFAVGAGHRRSARPRSSLGPLPALPLLAGLPHGAGGRTGGAAAGRAGAGRAAAPAGCWPGARCGCAAPAEPGWRRLLGAARARRAGRRAAARRCCAAVSGGCARRRPAGRDRPGGLAGRLLAAVVIARCAGWSPRGRVAAGLAALPPEPELPRSARRRAARCDAQRRHAVLRALRCAVRRAERARRTMATMPSTTPTMPRSGRPGPDRRCWPGPPRPSAGPGSRARPRRCRSGCRCSSSTPAGSTTMPRIIAIRPSVLFGCAVRVAVAAGGVAAVAYRRMLAVLPAAGVRVRHGGALPGGGVGWRGLAGRRVLARWRLAVLASRLLDCGCRSRRPGPDAADVRLPEACAARR